MRSSLATRTPFGALLSAVTGTTGHVEDRRASPRRQAALTAEVIIAGRSHVAQIKTISTGGLTLGFGTMPSLFKGAQLLVRAPGFAPFSGSVRWTSENECGLAFNVALAEEMLLDEAALFDPGKRARPGRARIKLPAIVRAPGLDRRVTIDNIGSGGAQISSGLNVPLTLGRGLMLEIDGLPPIGAYVRWCKPGRFGLMFSKLLPIAVAEEIAERCGIHPSWVKEVRTAHETLADSEA